MKPIVSANGVTIFDLNIAGLSILKQQYPSIAIHAYTATATQRVRADIVKSAGVGECQYSRLVRWTAPI